MFAGKSTAVLGILRRHKFIGRNTLCITSKLDTRYSAEAKLITHDMESYPSIAVDTLLPLIDTAEFLHAKCIIIEEAQFFPDIFEFVMKAVDGCGRQVICVGLDGDAKRKPFGRLLDLIPYADDIKKYSALCTRCMDGTKAIFTSAKVESETQISVGGVEQYEPLCRTHYLIQNNFKTFAPAEKKFNLEEFFLFVAKSTMSIPEDCRNRVFRDISYALVDDGGVTKEQVNTMLQKFRVETNDVFVVG